MKTPILFATLLLIGCDSQGNPEAGRQDSQIAVPATPARPAAEARAARARKVEEKNELVEFIYGWPAEAAAIPKLAARFEAELARHRATALETAREDKAGRTDDYPFNGHYFSLVWETYGNSRRLLSLGASGETFAGGAHGNILYHGLIWDRAADREIEPGALFTDAGRAFELMSRTYCPALNKERAIRRQESLPLQGEDWMVDCPALAEQILLPQDGDDGRVESFIVLIPPYEAGPYAEGVYVIEIPVTDALRRLIKSEYAEAF